MQEIAKIVMNEDGSISVLEVEPEPEEPKFPPIRRHKFVPVTDPTLTAHWDFTQ